MSTFDELDQRYYTKGLTFSAQEVLALIAAIASGRAGNVKLNDPAPVAPVTGQVINLIGAAVGQSPSGTYVNLLSGPGTQLVIPAAAQGSVIINAYALFNGTYWDAYWQQISTSTTNKLPVWSAAANSAADQVYYGGLDYVANAITAATDVPGVSGKWSERLWVYTVNLLSAVEQFYKSVNKLDKSVFTLQAYNSATPPVLVSSSFQLTDFIFVKPNTTYSVGNFSGGALVNASGYKTYHFAGDKSQLATFSTTGLTFTTAANEYFVRVNYPASQAGTYMLVEGGNGASVYSPYNKTIQTAALADAGIYNSKNLLDYTKNVTGTYGNDGVSLTGTSFRTHSPYIPVTPGQKLWRGKVGGVALALNIYTYDASKTPVSRTAGDTGDGVHMYMTVTTDPYFTIPAGVYFIRPVICPATDTTTEAAYMLLDATPIDANTPFKAPTDYIPYFSGYKLNESVMPPSYAALLKTSAPELNRYATGKSKLGAMDRQPLLETGSLNHFIIYGQSLSLGYQSPYAFTTVPMAGLYMLGNRVWINKGNANQSTTISPLIGSVSADNLSGETPMVAAMFHLKTLLNLRGKQVGDIIGTNAGLEGQSIERLSKEYAVTTPNLYTTEFTATINAAKAYATSVNKTIACPAIIWMQGEYNYGSVANQGMTSGSASTADKAQYKAYLLALKNNMQADIMAKYGQTKKPLFFIYQVAGSYIDNKLTQINMAMIEFADENADVIMMNPGYQTPDYAGGHMTTNGYRWYGEYIGKALGEALLENNRPVPFRFVKHKVFGKVVRIFFNVPVPPIQPDNATVQAAANYGFAFYINGVQATPSSIDIKDTYIDFTLIDLTDTATLEVNYASNTVVGRGNIKDSDSYGALLPYVDDSNLATHPGYEPLTASGGKLYGQPYPLQNWLSNFYYRLQN